MASAALAFSAIDHAETEIASERRPAPTLVAARPQPAGVRCHWEYSEIENRLIRVWEYRAE